MSKKLGLSPAVIGGIVAGAATVVLGTVGAVIVARRIQRNTRVTDAHVEPQRTNVVVPSSLLTAKSPPPPGRESLTEVNIIRMGAQTPTLPRGSQSEFKRRSNRTAPKVELDDLDPSQLARIKAKQTIASQAAQYRSSASQVRGAKYSPVPETEEEAAPEPDLGTVPSKPAGRNSRSLIPPLLSLINVPGNVPSNSVVPIGSGIHTEPSATGSLPAATSSPGAAIKPGHVERGDITHIGAKKKKKGAQ